MKLEVVTQQPDQLIHPTPLLFVHGTWHGPWCWSEHFIPFFVEQGFSVHALALRGHGGSDGASSLRETTLADYVEDVARVVGEFETTPVLIGHSMGGFIVQHFLARNEATAAVLLASTPPGGALLATLYLSRLWFSRHWRVPLQAIWRRDTRQFVSTEELVHKVLFSKGTPSDIVRECHARLQDDSFDAFMNQISCVLPNARLVHTPVMVLGAMEDAIFCPSDIARTARAYGTQHYMFPDMGHDMMLEPGWEDVASRIVEWLLKLGI